MLGSSIKESIKLKELLALIFGLAVGGLLFTVGLQDSKLQFVGLGLAIMGATMWTGLTKINKIQKLNALNDIGELNG